MKDEKMETAEVDHVINRKVSKIVLKNERFVTKGTRCDKQYFQAYFSRSKLMRERLFEAAKRKWGDDTKVISLSDVQRGVTCYLIGTLFKSMELQPSILTAISEKEHILVQPKREKFISDNDKIILEDEQQRISLKGNFEVNSCFTGTVAAVKGVENELGHFLVDEMVFAGTPMQAPIPVVNEDKYVLMVSGLCLGSKSDKLLSIQMLIDYVVGLLGAEIDHESSAKICHVIIAGNCLSSSTQDKESQKRAKYLTYKEEAKSVEGVKLIDDFVSELLPLVSVDLMSGEFDPCNYLLPQQPFHWCMLPKCAQFRNSSFRAVTNPYDCEIDGFRFIGTSGQNISNMKMYSGIADCTKLLELTLNFSHIAPTAPDTLGCFPFSNSDPFILPKDGCPHIYFAGNQPEFSSKKLEGNDGQNVLLLGVPDFSKTETACLINLKDLTVEPISFGKYWE